MCPSIAYNWRRKCAKSSITQPWIVRFQSIQYRVWSCDTRYYILQTFEVNRSKVKVTAWHIRRQKLIKEETEAIAMHCNLRPPDAAPVIIRLRRPCHCDIAQPIRCRLIAFYCWYVTLSCDLNLSPFTSNICTVSPVTWNSVPNFSKIKQFAAELLWFQFSMRDCNFRWVVLLIWAQKLLLSGSSD